jgi:hypothetical protein
MSAKIWLKNSKQTTASTGGEVDLAAISPDSVVAATRNASGNLDITLWKISGSDLKTASAASVSAGAISSLSLCRVAPDLFVSPVSDSHKQLKVIAWKINDVLAMALLFQHMLLGAWVSRNGGKRIGIEEGHARGKVVIAMEHDIDRRETDPDRVYASPAS